MEEYLKKFYVIAGILNDIPKLKDNNNYQNTLIDIANQVLKTNIPDNSIGYYEEIIKLVSSIEIMLMILKDPPKYQTTTEKVINDLREVITILTNKIVSRTSSKINTVSLPEEYQGLGTYLNNQAHGLNVDIATFSYSNERYDNFGKLIKEYLEAYINLVEAFYKKLDERSIELANLSLIKIIDYKPQEEHYLFFEIHNYLIKRLRDLNGLNLRKISALESYIERLTRGVVVMNLIASILNDEDNLANYKLMSELEDSIGNVFFEVDSYLRKWLRNLQNKHQEGVIRN